MQKREGKEERAKGSSDGIFKAVRHTFPTEGRIYRGNLIGEIISVIEEDFDIPYIYTYIYIYISNLPYSDRFQLKGTTTYSRLQQRWSGYLTIYLLNVG